MSEEQQATPSFSIEKVYVKDLSLEVPNAPAIFLEEGSPEISVQLQTGLQGLGGDAYSVILTVTVTSKLGDKTLFLVEVAQAGIFRISNVPDENLEPLLAVACPNILFPYAREVISEQAARAGFQPVLLQPVNFEALYAQQRAQQTSGSKEAPTVQ